MLAAQPRLGDTTALADLLVQDKALFDAYRLVQADARALVEQRRAEATTTQGRVLLGGAVAGLAVTGLVAVAVRRANAGRVRPSGGPGAGRSRRRRYVVGGGRALGAAAGAPAHGQQRGDGAARPAGICARLQVLVSEPPDDELRVALDELEEETRRVSAAVATLLDA